MESLNISSIGVSKVSSADVDDMLDFLFSTLRTISQSFIKIDKGWNLLEATQKDNNLTF